MRAGRLSRSKKSPSIIDPSMPGSVKTYHRRDTPLPQQDPRHMEGEFWTTLAVCGFCAEELRENQTNPQIPYCFSSSSQNLRSGSSVYASSVFIAWVHRHYMALHSPLASSLSNCVQQGNPKTRYLATGKRCSSLSDPSAASKHDKLS